MSPPRRPPGLTRRTFLRRVAGLGAVLAAPAARWPGRLLSPSGANLGETVEATGAGPIRARAAWGADLPPTGPLTLEAPGDVRFLLVHHSATPNAYAPGDVPGLLQSFYRTHTTAQGWSDIAYNFLVDRHGVIWEGREGSRARPVRGDATGGSQGFALLACWIGDHTDEPPTGAAQESMVGLLAGLCAGYGIDPQGTAAFVSRGSSLHPTGTEVTTPAIAGHRAMSDTACPGDAGQRVVTDVLPGRVTAALAQLAPAETSEDQPVEPDAPSGGAPPANAATEPRADDPAPAARTSQGETTSDSATGWGPGSWTAGQIAAGVASAAALAAGGATTAAVARSARSDGTRRGEPPGG